MSYSTVLASFKIDHEACFSVKDEVEPKFPKRNDRDNGHKIIRWFPIFKHCLTISCGSRDPLSHVLREDPVVTDETLTLSSLIVVAEKVGA